MVGAEYDRSYFDIYIKDKVDWLNLIGSTSISLLFAIVKKCKFVISYQSGIGVVASHLGIPTAMFWRAKGDSISADCYISFEENMATAWANPDIIAEGKYLPLRYGRYNPAYIIQEIKNKKW